MKSFENILSLFIIPLATLFSIVAPFFTGRIQEVSAASQNVNIQIGNYHSNRYNAAFKYRIGGQTKVKSYSNRMFWITSNGKTSYCIDPLDQIYAGNNVGSKTTLPQALQQSGLGISASKAQQIAGRLIWFAYYRDNPTPALKTVINRHSISKQDREVASQYFTWEEMGGQMVDGGEAVGVNTNDTGLGVILTEGVDYVTVQKPGTGIYTQRSAWVEYEIQAFSTSGQSSMIGYEAMVGPVAIGAFDAAVRQKAKDRCDELISSSPNTAGCTVESTRMYKSKGGPSGYNDLGWIPPEYEVVANNYTVQSFTVPAWYRDYRDTIKREIDFQMNLTVPKFDKSRVEIPVYQTATFTRTSGSSLADFFRDSNLPTSKPSKPNYKNHTYVWRSGNSLKVVPTVDAPNTDYDVILRSSSVPAGQDKVDEAFVFPNAQNQTFLEGKIRSKEVRVKVRALKYGQIKFTKQDSETGNTSQGEANMVGTKFKAELIASDYWKDQIGYTETVTIGSNLKGETSKKLPLGTYRITETPGVGYLKGDSFTIDIGPEDFGPNDPVAIVNKTVKNDVIKGRAQVTKKDDETGQTLAGAEFELRRNFKNGDRKVVEKIVTGDDGVARTGLHPYGDYKLVETKAPFGYTQNEGITGRPDEYDIKIREHNKTYTVGHENRYQWGGIAIKKQNALEPFFPWTNDEITLAGAEYEIRAVEMRLPNKTGAFKPGELVTTLTTDANGEAATGNILQLGTYDLVETKSPEGYEVNKVAVRFRIEYAGQTIEFSDQEFQDTTNHQNLIDHYNKLQDDLYNDILIPREANKTKPAPLDASKIDNSYIVTTNERPSLGRIELTKTREEFDDTQGGAAGPLQFEEGIVFSITNHEGKEVDTIVTNKQGWGSTNYLPYGKYTVTQETVLNEGDMKVKPFVVYVAKDMDGQLHEFVLKNVITPFRLRLIKVDEETGKVIPAAGVSFELYKEKEGGSPIEMKFEENGVIGKKTIFKTNDAGVVVFPEKLPYGAYFLQEIEAPEGYYLDPNGDRVEIKLEGDYNVAEFQMLNVEVENTPQKGQISLDKKGLVLKHLETVDLPADVIEKMETQGTLLEGEGTVHDGTKTPGQYIVPYFEDDFLEGAVFEIRAAEDIIGKDAVMDEDDLGNLDPESAEYTVHYKEGDLVETITTTRDGTVSSKHLPLGKYTLQEVEAPVGYLLDDTVHLFEFTPQSQDVHVTIDSHYQYNVKQEAKFLFNKSIEESEWFDHHVGAEEDVIFGLFAKEDIQLTSNMTGVIPKDTFLGFSRIELIDGQLGGSFGTMLAGNYYIKELSTAEAYELNENAHDLSFIYDTEGEPLVNIEYGETIENDLKRYEVELVKVSSGTEEKLENTSFEIYAINEGKDPIFIGEYITNEEGIIRIQDLEEGEYLIEETRPSAGHWTGEDPTLTVVIKGGKVTIEGEDVVVDPDGNKIGFEMENEKATASISKVDAETGKQVVGAHLAILSLDEEMIHDFVTTGEPYVLPDSVRLQVGDQYILRELQAPEGYATADDVVFLFENKAITEVEMVDVPINVDIIKRELTAQDEINGTLGKPLAGAELQLLDSEGNPVLVTVENENEDEEISAVAPEAQTSWITTEEPQRFKYLPVGTYTLRELQAPEGYATANDVVVEVLDTGELQTFDMNDETLKVEISKKDITNGEELPGAHLEIIDKETGETIYEWISSDEPHLIERIPEGDYILKETIAPDGYVTAEEIEFTITDNGVAHMVHMYDDVTKVEISKKDMTNGEELPGAHLQIEDADGGIVAEWISGDEPHYIEKLPVGEYTLTETIAPEGYVLSKVSVVFEITDSGEIHTAEMLNDVTKVEISKKDITNGEELPGAHLEIRDKETGEVVEEWVSSDKPHYIEKLPVGEYYLKETIAPDGYILSEEEIEFEIDHSGIVHHVEMFNSPEEPQTSAFVNPTALKVAAQSSGSFGLLTVAPLIGLGIAGTRKKEDEEEN